MATGSSYAEQFGDKFQQHILAVAARVPGFTLRYRTALSDAFFAADIHRIAAKALFEHVDEYGSLPTEETLVTCVRDITDEATQPKAEKFVRGLYGRDISDAKSVMNRIIEFGKLQALCNAVVACAEDIEKGKRDLILNRVQTAMLVGEDILDVGLDYRALADRRVDWYVNTDGDDLDMIPTGLTHLDLAMGGGLGKGELGVVLAPPKRGKTTTLVNFGFGAFVAAQGFNVAHYTCEMRGKRVSMRYDDRMAGSLVAMRAKSPEKYVKRLNAKIEKYMRGNLFVKQYNTREATVSMIRAHLTLLASQGFHPDMIIVDYADILKPERRLGEMRHEQAGIYEDLRSLAGDFDAAVWTASQARRGALEKDIITIDDFAEAFEKAAIVDAAIGFCQSDEERIDQKARLFLAALRNQQDGLTIECEIRRGICRIRTQAIYDPAGVRLDTDEDEPDTQAAPRMGRGGKSLRDRVGLAKTAKKKGPTRKGPQRKKTTRKKGPTRKSPNPRVEDN